MAEIDYAAEAELFPTRGRRTKPRSFAYRRFARAADAIRFAIEELPPALLNGAYLEVDEQRFDGEGIQRLYASEDYPLARSKAPSDVSSRRTNKDPSASGRGAGGPHDRA
jgi:hypothetical protein